MKRPSGVIGFSLVMMVSVAPVGCDQIKPPTPAEEFWKQFAEKNAAWLDPPAKPMHCTLVIARTDRSYQGTAEHYTDHWVDEYRIESWCAPGKNARMISWQLQFDPPRRMRESCYEDGKGGIVRIPPTEFHNRIPGAEWITARTGTTFAGILHELYWAGMREGATIGHPNPDTVVLRIDQSRPDPHWVQATAFDHSEYTLHNLGSVSTAFPLRGSVEIEIDAATLQPRRIVEKQGEQETTVEFDEAWLTLDGQSVPRRVSVRRSGEHAYTWHFEFQIRDGCWLVESAEQVGPVWSLCYLMRMENVEFEPIPPETFVYPTDVDLPEHSYTVLAPGERIIPFKTDDGLTLESKLSVPPDAKGPMPVVMLLHGAGPATFDTPYELPIQIQLENAGKNGDDKSPEPVNGYCDFWARDATHHGYAFFRTNKRGCAQTQDPPRLRTRREIFSRATPSVLLADYAAALAELRRQSDIDPSRIILVGESEGTVMATRLASRFPEGIIAIVLRGYAQDNTRDTIVWQNTMGPWRNVARAFDANGDDVITREEYDNGPERFRRLALMNQPLDALDLDKDGKLTPKDLIKTNADRLKVILKAVEEGDDNFLWQNLLNLTSGYCREDWERPPLHEELLKLNIPILIEHGDYDGTVRVEGVYETRAAFEQAGKMNLTVKIYPRLNHDLGVGKYIVDHVYPEPFADTFDFIEITLKTMDDDEP